MRAAPVLRRGGFFVAQKLSLWVLISYLKSKIIKGIVFGESIVIVKIALWKSKI